MQSDFRSMAEKHGRLAVVNYTSGTSAELFGTALICSQIWGMYSKYKNMYGFVYFLFTQVQIF